MICAAMATKHALVFILLLSSSNVFACQCVNVFNNSFLGNTYRFDFIVKGRIYKEDMDSLTLIIEETYKGVINKDTIVLGGRFGCDNLLVFKPGDRIIIGLDKFNSSNYPNTFVPAGCVTSALYVEGQRVHAPEFQLSLYKKPKVAMFKSRMRLKAFELKLKRKLSF